MERSIAAATATSASSKLVGLVLGSARWIAGLAPQSMELCAGWQWDEGVGSTSPERRVIVVVVVVEVVMVVLVAVVDVKRARIDGG